MTQSGKRLFFYGDICLMSGGRRSLIAIEEGLKSFFGCSRVFLFLFLLGLWKRGRI